MSEAGAKMFAGEEQRVDAGSVTSSDAPLSFGQQRLWLAYLLEPRSAVYNIPLCFHLKGNLDIHALEQSLSEIVRRHDVLRTSIVVKANGPRQTVLPCSRLMIPLTDLRDLGASLRFGQALEYAGEEARRPFDLSSGPLFRTSLFKLDDQEHLLLFIVHHIAFDGWSTAVFLQELGFFYESYRDGKTSVLPEPPLRYADFAAWQRELVGSEAMREHLSFWRELLDDNPRPLDIPKDHQSQGAQSSEGDTLVYHISASPAEGLKRLAKSESGTFSMTLLAAFVAQLHRYTGQDDIVIGIPVAGRTHPDVESVIGFFVNTIPIRIRIVGDPTFRELVRSVRSVIIGGLAHQDVPLEKITEELHLSHDFGRTPLFQVLFSFESFLTGPPTISGLQVEAIDIHTKTAKFDITLTFREEDCGLHAALEYRRDLFEKETVRRMTGHNVRLLEHVSKSPDTRLSQLPLLTEAERQQIVVEWNAINREYPRDRSIHELFEEQVRLVGARVALISGDERVTYNELNRRANRLAHRLRKEGVQAEVLVGLCMERSVEMVVGMMGILKAGGAYLPVDPEYPQERIRYMLENGRVRLIVTNSQSLQKVLVDNVRGICVDTERENIVAEEESDLPNLATPQNLAYVMYTSGSTGKAKGVCVIHRGVVRLVKGNSYASFGPDEVFLQLAPFSFDASTFEIWGSLLNGGRLVIGPPQLPTHDELGRIIKEEHVTTLWLTAGLFHNIVDVGLETLAGLRQLLVGGDVVSPLHAAKFKARYPDCRLINGYGPTENTTFTCCYEISGNEVGPLPIGRPIANTSVYILDRYLQPVPVGVTGELCIGGDGLARGYLNDEKLTAEKFITNSVAQLGSRILYRTGDRARYRDDGVIMFEGRKDSQVKISGYRVETEEVEAVLRSYPGLAQVVVVGLPSSRGEKRLVAYCVPRPGRELAGAVLRTYMQERVPSYMIPSSFIVLTEFPLSAQGKVDRHALPEPGEIIEGTPRVAPRDPLEVVIASIWTKLFAIDSIGIRDDFFELGGHSLLAFHFFAELEKSTGAKLPLATLFEAPTIEQLAMVIRKEGWRPPWSCLVPIKRGGSRPPIYFVHAVGGNVINMYDLAHLLHPDQPLFGLQSMGLDGRQPPLSRIEDMAKRYIDEIKVLQPHGPYLLGGFSFGGMVAFEMAHQLLVQGDDVALLALVDTMVLPDSSIDVSAIRRHFVRLRGRVRHHLWKILTLPPREKLDHIRVLTRQQTRKIRSRYRQRTHDFKQPPTGSLSDPQYNVKQENLVAAQIYRAHEYPGTVTLFLASDRGVGWAIDAVYEWSLLAKGGVKAITVPGNHVTVLSEPHVKVLAQRLDECLGEINASVGGGRAQMVSRTNTGAQYGALP